MEKAKNDAEIALEECERRYKSLINNLNVGVYRKTEGPDGRFVEANPAVLTIFGFDDREEFLNSNANAFYAEPPDMEAFAAEIEKAGMVRNIELKLLKKDGSEFVGSVSSVAVRDDNGEIQYFDGIIEDISERKRSDLALMESEKRYRTLLEANPDPMVVYDKQGSVVFFNPAFEKVFGWSLEECQGKKMDFFVPEESWQETRQMILKVRGGEGFTGVETFRYNKKGDVIPVIINGAVYKDPKDDTIGCIVNLRDVRAQKEIEARLQQSQKMEAIGTLAGGIAHDFNNILSAILGYSELALMDLPADHSIRAHLEAVHSSGVRARDLVAQILAFSRKGEQVRSPVDLNWVVKDALKLLRPAIPTTIDIQAQIAEGCRISGDPSQIHQIIMNLCTNAYQAMLETGGVLSISLSKVKMNVIEARRYGLLAGDYGKLTVSDTGVGITPENLRYIFDPYFTTKEKGKGTGLGLAAVHGIAREHGGTVLPESTVGQGATFKVYLPLIQAENIEEVQETPKIKRGKERILLVDDEQDTLEVEQRMLEKLGYDLTAMSDSRKALELFSDQPDQFDIVITDMTMPGMTGDKLANEMISIQSDIPIILCTGFSEFISKEEADAMGIKGFLMKPVRLEALANEVRNVLDQKKDG